jgi:glycosyltransferase involved in cell wall biosynthesis
MLSVIVLTKNDEAIVAKCLESIKDQDWEIIAVDSYSTDKTLEILKKYKIKAYQNHFTDFSSQRNYALSLTKGDWILYLDSDEVVTDEFKKEVNSIVSSDHENYTAYFVQRSNYFLGKKWSYTDRMQRLFKKEKFISWEGKLHETAHFKGSVGQINAPIFHFTHRILEQMIEKTNECSDYEAELRIKASHPLMTPLRFIRVMITGFLKSYIKENGYRNGTKGFIESVFQAFSIFITYAKLFEKQEGKK